MTPMYQDVQLVVRELQPGSEDYRVAEKAENDSAGTRAAIEETGRRFPIIADPSLPRRRLTAEEARALRELERIVPHGKSLRRWLEDEGDYTFELPGPDGHIYQVSLERWRGRDPETTFLSVGFRSIDTRLVGTKMTDVFPPGS